MEIARMNYYFTGILVVLLCLLAWVGPAYPRNEYLNSYPNECRTGEVDVSVSRRDYDYNNYTIIPGMVVNQKKLDLRLENTLVIYNVMKEMI